jgi:crossover junction endodeoxyribonuclease RuvC
MRVLGVDPGSVVCGYGVVEQVGKKLSLIEYGVIEARRQHEDLPQRLKLIYDRLGQVIARSLPDELAIETIFYSKNVASIVKLAHARSAAILAAIGAQVPTAEYAPRFIKRAVTGNGAAGKDQVQYMVKTLLDIEETPQFYDATDALAIAICHLYQLGPLAGGLVQAGKSKPLSTSTTKQKRGSRSSKAASWAEFVAKHPDRVK